MGFVVTERPFTFSSFPGRFATPLTGAALAMCVGFAGLWALGGSRYGPSTILLSGMLGAIVVGRWLTVRGVLAMPLLAERGVNLEAVMPGDTPRVWLCAHLDSKSQPIPTLVRSAGIITEAFGVVMAMVLALIESVTAVGVPNFYWLFAGLVTLLGALPVVMSMVGNRSPGALDNASGVATVIAAARRLEGLRGVGVLITDAEELGLAGARAWSVGRARTTVLNVDGVDDTGEIGHLRFPGLLTDANAFRDAGHKSFTVSRGGLGSLMRVHSRRDDLSRLRGDGIEPTARYVGDLARQLLGETA